MIKQGKLCDSLKMGTGKTKNFSNFPRYDGSFHSFSVERFQQYSSLIIFSLKSDFQTIYLNTTYIFHKKISIIDSFWSRCSKMFQEKCLLKCLIELPYFFLLSLGFVYIHQMKVLKIILTQFRPKFPLYSQKTSENEKCSHYLGQSMQEWTK